ncbi:MAG: bifunctional folylpolyglutamate synthase/dihydrofolate synthase [Nitrospirae bacterium]|nr:bifunctional folylpolyglutamate synthase/dihydrofolate synthase [Nitrospirota bacterium]
MLTEPDIYKEATEYLYGLQKHGIKLGLSNITALTGILGNPQKSFRSIHVAGTNGKGSTTAMVASILSASGYNVGTFTSPHLVSFTERIKVNNAPISESEVATLTHKIRNSIAGTGLNPTFFEVVTALGFYYLASRNVDWAVIETGMGGRLDATNIILPEISIITNIDMDHAEYLGSSISEISLEKAGIIKPGIPVVTAATQPEALKQILETAGENDSAAHIYGKDFESLILEENSGGLVFNYDGYRRIENIPLNLTGGFQAVNASLAIRASEILNEKAAPLGDISVKSALSGVKMEGRIEIISEHPKIILDSAHNPAAAGKLSGALMKHFGDKKIIIIIGIMKDKDLEGILKPLMEISDTMIFTRPEGERAALPQTIYDNALNLLKNGSVKNNPSLMLTASVDEALTAAKISWNDDKIICITGSFYTAGKAKELLGFKGVLSGLRE